MMDLTPPQPRDHRLFGGRKTAVAEIGELRAFIARLLERATPEGYAEMERELREGRSDLAAARSDRDAAESRLAQLQALIVETDEIAVLQEIGIYEYRHEMEHSADYKDRLNRLREQYRETAKGLSKSVAANSTWTVNGSSRDGKRMVSSVFKLLLRAYNNEADSLREKLRPFKLQTALERLDKARASIEKLGAPLGINIASNYHRLRRQELELAADWIAKKEEEKEIARAERERIKEEAAAQRELAAQLKKLDQEREKYEQAIQKARDTDPEADLTELEEKLSDVVKAHEDADFRAKHIGAGHIYVISNIGSFGDRIVKIGMTRRLDPMDRVKELGDASVPFKFDVHAMVFSEDAVALENELHDKFARVRVNLVNNRREFFYVGAAEVMAALEATEVVNRVMVFTETALAEEYRTSENTRRAMAAAPGG